MSLPLEIVILAAGQGKRMHSDLPKVLHALGGRPLLAHVLACARALAPRAIHVVYGHGGEAVPAAFVAETGVNWVHQAERHGTGHALAQALPGVAPDALVLVLYGDVPLIRPETLRPLAHAAGTDTVALLTAELPEPGAYGRVLRDAAGRVARIVEARDASASERTVREVNTGFLAAPAARLRDWLARIGRDNAQGEYYLTDIIALAVAEGVTVVAHRANEPGEVLGVNSKTELARLERSHQQRQAEALMAQGVTLRDPARFDLRGELTCGRDVVIDVNVVFEGRVTLADGVVIGPNNYLRDCAVGAGSVIQPNCVIEQAEIGADCRIGPFARLRPGTRIGDRAHVGNFVEIKNSTLGAGAKANHLAYVGDATVGEKVNIGAGAITANYDGAHKWPTAIGDDASIGANCVLVAPVTIGAGATIGAGSVVSKEAPAGELTVARARQVTVKGWKRPQKKK
jgi:bifunctional UDP-N-acetylglucosamine pyrophosphorylase/glucosamine-1-phosphate N-acetyltransferase